MNSEFNKETYKPETLPITTLQPLNYVLIDGALWGMGIIKAKRMNEVYRSFIILLIALLSSCKMSATNNLPENSVSNTDFAEISIEKDSIISLIFDYIIFNPKDIDGLSSLLSHISKKSKIETADWKTKYDNSGRLYYYTYVSYRLIVLYNFNFSEVIIDEERRLDFFIASVRNSDYEILDLLDFKDNALDGNSCYGETVLTAAVRNNDIQMVKYLLEKGVDKNKREYPACDDDAQEEQNAYEIAVDLEYKDIADLLIE